MQRKHVLCQSASLIVSLGVACALSIVVPHQTFASFQPQAEPTVATYTPGQKSKMKGLIVSRSGDIMKVRDAKGVFSNVILNDETEIVSPKGMFKTRTKKRDATSLLPGLRVEVEGVADSNSQLNARKITFNSDDLETAQQISAGQYALQEQQQQTQKQVTATQQEVAATKKVVAENKEGIEMLNKRMSDLDEYETKDTAMVNFASGSTSLSPESKQNLGQFVQKNKGTENYLVEVAGFADTTGSEARNQELSKQRAEAVVAYLVQVCRVPTRRILAPTGMGTSMAIAANTTAAGRAENRRVEVKVIVNKAMSADK